MVAAPEVAEGVPEVDPEVKRACKRTLAELETIRTPWDTRCRDVTDFIFPYGGRYQGDRANDGIDRTRLIIDATATKSMKMLSSGMLSYSTSRARPWFALTVRDRRLAKRPDVKQWLFESTEVLRDILAGAGANTYTALRKSYDELGAFGTSCTFMEPNFHSVIRLQPVTNGRFYLADNYNGEVDTCYRKLSLTVAQLGDEFGVQNLSPAIATSYKGKQNLNQRHDVIHAVYPRRDRDPNNRTNKNKKFASLWFEAASADDKVLRESGYDVFPVLAPRWDTTGGDVYGNGPGFDCLQMVKQLQQEQLRKAKAIDQLCDPARQGPTSLKEKDVNGEPSGFTPVDLASPSAKVQNLVDVQIDLSHLLADIQFTQQQIEDAFYVPAFRVFTNSTTDRQTTDEIRAKSEEKMVQLGPVTSNLDNEQNDPLIRFAFEQAWRGGALPPPPDDLAGQLIEIEYVSALAQAQKAIGANSIDRFTSYVGMIGAVKQDAWDVVNTDTMIERYADKMSIDPDLIVPGPQRALIRQSRARAQAAADQTQMMNTTADTGQKLAATPIGASQPTALDALARLTGVGGAS